MLKNDNVFTDFVLDMSLSVFICVLLVDHLQDFPLPWDCSCTLICPVITMSTVPSLNGFKLKEYSWYGFIFLYMYILYVD